MLGWRYEQTTRFFGTSIGELKFHSVEITEIFREINFRDTRSAKCAILTHLEALNFDF